jgi:hypothetical protein
MKKHLAGTEFASDTQPGQIRLAQMPTYIEALKGRAQDAAWLGSTIIAKVSCCVVLNRRLMRVRVVVDLSRHEELHHKSGL